MGACTILSVSTFLHLEIIYVTAILILENMQKQD